MGEAWAARPSPAQDLSALIGEDGTSDIGWVREAYSHEAASLMRRRLYACVAIPVGFLGIATGLETHRAPELGASLGGAYAIQVLACGLCALVARTREDPRSLEILALATLAVLLATMGFTSGLVGLSPQSFALALVCTLNGVAILLPWSGWNQAAAAALALAVFAGFLHRFAPGAIVRDPGVVLSLLAASTTAVAASHVLARHRRESFVRSAQLWREWIRKQEEADISAALVFVGETLSANVGKPDLLAGLNRVVVDLVACDWSGTYLLDEDRGVYRLCSGHGPPRFDPGPLAEIEFPENSLPLLDQLRAGELVELSDTSRQELVPPDLARVFHVASALFAPICLGTQVIGVIVNGHVERRGAFSSRQRRLTLGIAHATAIALANQRLVHDLRDANRLKSEFVATMSHELRTPLNVISGYAEMLEDGELGAIEDSQRDAIRRIRRSSRELLELVDATLDLGRLEAGRDFVRMTPVDLRALCAEIGLEVESLLRPEVELAWPSPAALARPVLADRGKLKTILKNLIGNALKFTARGSVALRIEHREDETLFEVRDTGIGIPADSVQTVFEMFRQVDGSATRRFGGVGLGLYIVRRLAGQMGGEVSVHSCEGEGSTFVVSIPGPSSRHEGEPAARPAGPGPGTPGRSPVQPADLAAIAPGR